MDNISPVDVREMDVLGYDLTNLLWTGSSDATTWDINNTTNWSVGGVKNTSRLLAVTRT